jgi:hypothetical protein
MTRASWNAHMAAEGFSTRVGVGPEALANAKAALAHMKSGCPVCAARRVTRKATKAARGRREAMRSLGLSPVRGGGWE